jgi:hypothetical protein
VEEPERTAEEGSQQITIEHYYLSKKFSEVVISSQIKDAMINYVNAGEWSNKFCKLL